MQHFNLERVCQATLTGCYFYPGLSCCIIVKEKRHDKIVIDLLEKLNNEIPSWLRLETPRKTRTKIEFQNDSKILIFNGNSIIKGITINVAFVDKVIATESLFQVLIPGIISRDGKNRGHLGENIILFDNV